MFIDQEISLEMMSIVLGIARVVFPCLMLLLLGDKTMVLFVYYFRCD